MSKLKKVLLMCTAYVLVAALAIGGTIAYLQDSDSDVNVMTLGNVSIAQHEYQRAEGVAHNAGESGQGNGVKEGALVPYEQNQALYPAVPKNNAATDYTAEATDLFFWGDYVYSGTAGNGLWNDDKLSNVMDKMVFVENTGKTDAYVRTLIAFECPEGMEYSESADKEFMMNVNGGTYEWEEVGYITVDGVRYLVMTGTYNKVLNPGNTSHPSLLQVVMTHNATNEDMELLGETYEILVLSQAVQSAGFENAATALDTSFGDDNVENAAKWFKGVVDDYAASQVDTWDGTADTSWYSADQTVFTLTSAEQLAGMNQLIGEGVTFEGKTIQLDADMDMAAAEWKVPVENFSGTFDGQGHTILNLHRTVNEYERGGRLGLFAHVENGTVKNVTLENADFYGYGPYGGVVCGSAYGDCTFENITLTDCNNEMYNTGSGGIVGLGYSESDYVFTNINIDSSNTIGSYWGSPDTATGGLIGYYWVYGEDNGSITVKDSYFAQEMNVYNDVVANYQWYAYRLSGMLVGYVATTENVDGTTYPVLDDLVCENVTVEYGDWADYYYCEMEKCGHPSYSGEDDYKFTRLVKISSVDEIYDEENDWNNDFVILNGETATCYHVVRDADTREVLSFHTHTAAEDNICVKLTFDQLYGGNKGVYGETEHDGVTVIYNNK